MKELLNASFLICGTAIGAGLIALPLMAANLGIQTTIAIVIFMVFIAYQSSMMTLDLNEREGRSVSIVEMSKIMSGRGAFGICLLSFYALSLSLLTAYFSGVADSLKVFLNIENGKLIAPLCGLGLFAILCLNLKIFMRLNTFLVVILLSAIAVSLAKIHISGETFALPEIAFDRTAFFSFLPIIFTSFGVQNICPHIYEYLNGDRRKINQAFLIGIIVPAIIYIIWIYFVFENILARDRIFFTKLQQHQIAVGELIKFLCESSDSLFMEISFKILSLFAIVTSAIGIALGLLKSVQETISSSRKITGAIICAIPLILVLCVPNAFISVLSFGGMIATIFVIFIPYHLLRKSGGIGDKSERRIAYKICLLFGAVVVLCELLNQ